MSLQDNKNALFGKTPMSSVPDTKKSTSTSSTSTSSTSSSTNKSSGISRLTVSPELKAKKLAEARENEEKANKALKTSIFQWSPDHVLAGSSFDVAGGAYKTAEEYESSIQAFLKAADSHESCDSYGAAALSLQKAAEISKQLGRSEQTASIYFRTSQLWGLRGEIVRVGEFLCKAAKEIETVNPEKAKEYYIDGINYMCPPETTLEQMNSTCPALAPDLFGEIFKFHLKYRATQKNLPASSYRISLPDIISFANRVITVYDGLEMEASACRLRVAITLLQLESGDVIAADRTFLDHLSDSNYLKSNESKLAEMFLMAFKQMDVDQLDEAQKSHILSHLDRDIQGIAKNLSLLANHNAPISAIVPSKSSGVNTIKAQPAPVIFDSLPSINSKQTEQVDEDREYKSDNNYNQNNDNDNDDNNNNNNNQEDEDDFDALVEGSTIQPKEEDDDELDLT